MKAIQISTVAILGIGALTAQITEAPSDPAVLSHSEPSQPEFNNERILGVMPNYLTVNDPRTPFKPLTTAQKFKLFVRETTDPFTFLGAGIGAAISQADNDMPKYGQGRGAFADRFGAAVADVSTQNFFSTAVLASVLHEDPRYFRRGPEYSFLSRVAYSLSRIVITRTDGGRSTFNYAGVFGMTMGIALSNAYYPAKSIGAPEFGSRVTTSLLSSALGNLLPEFWPDVQRKVFRHHKN